MQNAYISEKGDSVGTWYLIGYNGPGDWTVNATTKQREAGAQTKSTNFQYDDYQAPNKLSDLTDSKAFGVTNINKLNDCAPAENWTIEISKGDANSAAGEAQYKAKVSGAGCDALTPNFSAIK